ncbi:ABC transporter ATP-binding protein [Kitasatospora sp. NPDC001660]
MVEVEHVSRRFRTGGNRWTDALTDVSLSVAAGEVVGLLGPNGAGKTTLSRILTTLLLPCEGRARVAGYDVVRDAAAARERIGLVLGGERGLYGRLTARQNLRYWAALRGVSGREGRRRADELLERLGLSARADERVQTYSRGMVQRLHLARAMISSPPLLIMDEPTSGMDPHAAQGFRALVAELRAGGTTIMLATHDMQEAQELCSRVAMIDRGRILRLDTTRALLADVGVSRVVTAVGAGPAAVAAVAAIAGAGTGAGSPDGRLTVEAADTVVAGAVVRALGAHGVHDVSVAAPTLAQVYRTVIEDREFTV